ncbi:MAG: hypothetical protein ACJ788_15995, partial [Ktedonobacteraceae bacterium]
QPHPCSPLLFSQGYTSLLAYTDRANYNTSIVYCFIVSNLYRRMARCELSTCVALTWSRSAFRQAWAMQTGAERLPFS